MELLFLGLDFFDHTLNLDELNATVLPLATAVTDFVASYYASSGGKLEIWPTQSLEGCVRAGVRVKSGVRAQHSTAQHSPAQHITVGAVCVQHSTPQRSTQLVLHPTAHG